MTPKVAILKVLTTEWSNTERPNKIADEFIVISTEGRIIKSRRRKAKFVQMRKLAEGYEKYTS